jgi:Ca2+:H+ antiporter
VASAHSAPVLPVWSIVGPIVGWLLLVGTGLGWAGWYEFLVAMGLCASVLAAVHHAEVVAHRVG